MLCKHFPCDREEVTIWKGTLKKKKTLIFNRFLYLQVLHRLCNIDLLNKFTKDTGLAKNAACISALLKLIIFNLILLLTLDESSER